MRWKGSNTITRRRNEGREGEMAKAKDLNEEAVEIEANTGCASGVGYMANGAFSLIYLGRPPGVFQVWRIQRFDRLRLHRTDSHEKAIKVAI
jgi:hypothetical protein